MQSTINSNIEKKCYTKKIAIFSTMHIEKKKLFLYFFEDCPNSMGRIPFSIEKLILKIVIVA